MLARFKHILFDLDGTIYNTEYAYTMALFDVVKKHDPNTTETYESLTRFMGSSAENTNKTKNYTKKEKYFLHKGGEYLDPNILFDLVKSTIKDFDINLNHEANTILIYETLITETLGGQYPYSYACYNYKNYGIAQIRVETANFLKGFIKRVSKHDYNLLMSLRVNDKSEKWNLQHSNKVCRYKQIPGAV